MITPCNKCGGNGKFEVTRDMAMDAGDKSMEGIFSCADCNGAGYVQTPCIHCTGDHNENDCPHWEATSLKYIWHNKADNTYWFSDEGEQIDGNGPYSSMDEADKALTEYVKHL